MMDSSPVSNGTPLPAQFLRKNPLQLPMMSEAETACHFIALSRLDGVGRVRGFIASLPPQFLTRHPAAPDDTMQGMLACLYELQEMLRAATGMEAVSLAPQSELHSVFACMSMLRAFHDSRGDSARVEILARAPVPDVVAAGAVQCGYTLREITLDATSLKAAAGAGTAALLVTDACASDLLAIVRGEGGLICGLGAVRGADVLSSVAGDDHEARAWCIMAAKPLAHFLPLPIASCKKEEYRLLTEKDLPLSIGRLSAHLTLFGQADALLHCFAYRHAAQAASTGNDS